MSRRRNMTNQTYLLKTAAVLFSTTLTFSINAQEVETTENTWIGKITSDNTAVRCGANESYYPLQVLSTGDVVQVVGKRQDWYQIVTDGKSFDGVVGYIKYPEKNSSSFMLDGEHGTSGGDLEIIAKNIESDEMYRSWRPVYRLSSGDVVRVIQTEKMAPGTLHREAYVVHTVDLPSKATAWINVSFVTKTTESVPEGAAADESLLPVDIKATEVLGETSELLDTETTGNEAESYDDASELNTLTLAELEDAWTVVSKEPVMGAEIAPLYDLYGQLLEENLGDIVIKRISNGRMKQLEIWKQLKSQKERIADLRVKLGVEAGVVHEYVEVMSMYGDYTVVGRLALSNTFNGKIRPFMYRVQNNSGRTIGYLPANPEWDLSSMIGQVVGVNGQMNWDAAWRVHVVDATGFDLLAPTTAEVPSDIQ